jgi:HSP20 family protein
MSWDEDIDRWMRRWRNMPFFRGFKEMDQMFDEMLREMLKDVPTDLYKERRLPGGGIVRQAGPFVYGYSMTVGPDGKPVIREFGNVKPSKRPTPFGFDRPSLELKEEREPLVDVLPENGTLRVIAEVPGIEKKDIKLNCTESALTISVNTENRKYYKTINLPDVIDPKVSKASYVNGVLEVILTKVKKEQPKGQPINIE